MVNAAKRKGDRAELEVAHLLADLLGLPVRRKLGAGRRDDTGDLDGIPDTVIQVAHYTDLARALREKVDACRDQQARAGATFGAVALKSRSHGWLFVLTADQFATYVREAL